MFPKSIPTRRDARWRLLEAALSGWFPALPRGKAPGVPSVELERAEARLGRALPAALREFYARFGARRDVWCVQDSLQPPGKLALADDRLLILREAQGVVRWSIRGSDLHFADPPVWLDDGAKTHMEAESISSFALQSAALSAKFSHLLLPRANGSATKSACRAIAQQLPRLPFPDMVWPAAPTRLYGDSELLVELNSTSWLWVTARTPRAFQRARDLVEPHVRWEMLDAGSPE